MLMVVTEECVTITVLVKMMKVIDSRDLVEVVYISSGGSDGDCNDDRKCMMIVSGDHRR